MRAGDAETKSQAIGNGVFSVFFVRSGRFVSVGVTLAVVGVAVWLVVALDTTSGGIGIGVAHVATLVVAETVVVVGEVGCVVAANGGVVQVPPSSAVP